MRLGCYDETETYLIHIYQPFFTILIFRPKSDGGCFTTGFVQNSQIQWTLSSKVGSCPGGPIKQNDWINIIVSIHDQRVSVQASKKHIVTATTHFPAVGRAGVLRLL